MLGEKEKQNQAAWAVGAHANDVNKLIDWLIFFWKLRLDQGLIGCHVKWTLATPVDQNSKKERFYFMFYRQNCNYEIQKLKNLGEK